MTTVNLNNQTVNVEAHPMLVDAGSSGAGLHKLAAEGRGFETRRPLPHRAALSQLFPARMDQTLSLGSLSLT